MHFSQNILYLLAFLFLTSGFYEIVGPVSAEEGNFSVYKLNAGDKIRITVFGEENMDVETILTDAGSISYPLLGEIKIQGMTLNQLQEYLNENLSGGYFINPKINVSITEYRKFFVNGEVKSPGGFAYEPKLTSAKVIAMAGGFTPRASEDDIIVVRDMKGQRISRKLALDELILPGDIITVEESFF